ncbi:MAG: hypothetical protein Q8P81_01105 [Nanoarchaeota archaeon]|nr:hypothetical protein [Nanoarchaeota archaeon]
MGNREISGIIHRDYGELCRGIRRLDPLEIGGREYPRTCVEWASSLPQEGGDLEGHFIFYETLPSELRGKTFVFNEESADTDLPLWQRLSVHGEDYCQDFSFKGKNDQTKSEEEK